MEKCDHQGCPLDAATLVAYQFGFGEYCPGHAAAERAKIRAVAQANRARRFDRRR